MSTDPESVVPPDPAEPVTPARPVTSGDIRSALKLRYPRESHALLWEVADSTGAAQRRFADAVVVGLWPSHGHEIEGIEIKVSRGDFLSELKKPEKSQPVFQFCRRWWLATPKGLVHPDELPDTWGLLELVGDSLRVKVKAPKLEPIAPTLGFLASLIRRHAGYDEDMTRGQIMREVNAQVVAAKERLNREFEQRRSQASEQATRGLEKLDAIKAATGIDLTVYKGTEDMVAAIKVAQELTGSWNPVRNLLHALKQLEQAIGELPQDIK